MFRGPISILAGMLLLCAVGCGSDKNGEKSAESLLSEARGLFDSGKYEPAMTLLDSIDSAYSRAIKTRTEAKLLRPQVIERLSAKQLSVTDSLLVVNALVGDSLRRLVRFEKNPVEGYYVASSSGSVNPRTAAGLYPRLSPDFRFYLICSCPEKIASEAVAFESEGETVTSAEVAYDGERNDRTPTCETITFTESESEPLLAFLMRHKSDPVTVRFIGANGKNHAAILSEQQRDQLLTVYGLATSVRTDKYLRLEKERLQNCLSLSRQQIARSVGS